MAGHLGPSSLFVQACSFEKKVDNRSETQPEEFYQLCSIQSQNLDPIPSRQIQQLRVHPCPSPLVLFFGPGKLWKKFDAPGLRGTPKLWPLGLDSCSVGSRTEADSLGTRMADPKKEASMFLHGDVGRRFSWNPPWLRHTEILGVDVIISEKRNFRKNLLIRKSGRTPGKYTRNGALLKSFC